MNGIKRFLRQSTMSFKALFGWLDPLYYILLQILSPILKVIFFALLAKFVYKTNDITPWVIGSSFLLCTSNAVFGIGNTLTNERFNGTLKLVIASPANKFLVFIGRAAMHIVDSVITVTIGLLVGFFFFGLRIPLNNLFLFYFTIFISMFSAMGIGLFIGSLGLITRDIHILLNTAENVLMILSGALFPISRLPLFLQYVSPVIPISHGIKAARLLTDTYNLNEVLRLISTEFIIGSIYILLGYILLIIIERKAREHATLDLY